MRLDNPSLAETLSWCATGQPVQARRAADESSSVGPSGLIDRETLTLHRCAGSVQSVLRHSSLRITLETYVHWWPRKQRRRNVVGNAIREATAKRHLP